MSYRDALHFLVSATDVLELCNNYGGRIAVCPLWHGRVMTSACDGIDGESFGLVNVAEIERAEAGEVSPFFGGEDQLVFSPEGGSVSLYYDSPKTSLSSPCGFAERELEVDVTTSTSTIVMKRQWAMENLAGATLDVGVVRSVRLIGERDLSETFGESLTLALTQGGDISYVAFETINTLMNHGAPFALGQLGEFGQRICAPRVRSFFNASEHTVAILPFRDARARHHGISIDYFGLSPHQRLRFVDRAVTLRADGEHRCQVGATYLHALPFVGAIDFRAGILTLVHYSLPPFSSEPYYLLNAACEVDHRTAHDSEETRQFYRRSNSSSTLRAISAQGDSIEEREYNGDAVRLYNSGPMLRSDAQHLAFYSFETCAPARALQTNEANTHKQQTIHIAAAPDTLRQLLREYLWCDYDLVFAKMFR